MKRMLRTSIIDKLDYSYGFARKTYLTELIEDEVHRLVLSRFEMLIAFEKEKLKVM